MSQGSWPTSAPSMSEWGEATAWLSERDGAVNEAVEVAVGDEDDPQQLGVWTRSVQRRSEDWFELAAWVDMMMEVHGVTELPSCWLAHEGMVCELAALHDAWMEASMTTFSQRASSAMMSWYQYSWWPWRQRISDNRRCSAGHIADVAGVATDRSFLPDHVGTARPGVL